MRISRHQMFMEIAQTVAKRSVCMRLNVGSIIVLDNRVVSIGYNGPGPGKTHCEEIGCEVIDQGGCSRSLHAERNAIERIPESCQNKTLELYTTHSPCRGCAHKIIDFGKNRSIRKVFFGIPYRDTEPIAYMKRCGVEVYQCAPNGYVNVL